MLDSDCCFSVLYLEGLRTLSDYTIIVVGIYVQITISDAINVFLTWL